MTTTEEDEGPMLPGLELPHSLNQRARQYKDPLTGKMKVIVSPKDQGRPPKIGDEALIRLRLESGSRLLLTKNSKGSIWTFEDGGMEDLATGTCERLRREKVIEPDPSGPAIFADAPAQIWRWAGV